MIKLKSKPVHFPAMQYWSWGDEPENYFVPLTQEQCNYLAERLRELADADDPQEYVDSLHPGAAWDARDEGVCMLLDAFATPPQDYAKKHMTSLHIPSSWAAEFAGCGKDYPVPAPHDFIPPEGHGIFTASDSPACFAFYNLHHWEGEYGEMRRNYCHYMADRLEGMTDEEAS